MPTSELHLDKIDLKIPAILPGEIPYYRNACVAVLDDRGHSSGAQLEVYHNSGKKVFEIKWEGEVSEQHKRAHGNLSDAVEFGACVLAMLLINNLTPYTVVEKAVYGTNVDYYLSEKSDDDILIFNNTKRLEVSGIIKEDKRNSVQKRLQEKIDRVDSDLSTFYCVVEFGCPWAVMVSCHE